MYEAKQKYSKIADFITEIDEEEKLVLLPYTDFLKRFNSLEELEKYRFLGELKDCILFEKISTRYITNEWTKFNLKQFVLNYIKTMENNVLLEDKLNFKIRINKEIQNMMDSDLSVGEKIISLAKIKIYYLDCVGRLKVEDDDLLFEIENKLELLKIIEKRAVSNPKILNINKKYIDFWMQFTKKNLKSNEPYLSKEDIVIFLNQAFGGESIKKTFNPDIIPTELHHAAWLFYDANKKDFKKEDVAQMMKDNFPAHFSDVLKEAKDQMRDKLVRNKRVFHWI